MALAIDHRSQVEAMADEAGVPHERITAFKRLAVDAAARIAKGADGFGMLLDGRHGREALFRAGDHGFWIARPVELPGSRPLRLRVHARTSARNCVEWPLDHVVKCTVLLPSRRRCGRPQEAEQQETLRSAVRARTAASVANC
jgi:5-dehydro-2-deoxygluconokinase